MRRPGPADIALAVAGLVLLLVVCIPFFWIGPGQVLDVCGALVTEEEFPGGRPAACLVLAFVLSLPFVGVALLAVAVKACRGGG